MKTKTKATDKKNTKSIKEIKEAFTKKQVIDMINQTRGNVALMAGALGVHRSTIYRQIERFGLEQELIDQKETQLDITEAALFKNIRAGNVTAQIWHLKTQGKHRGWTELDTAADGKQNITINFITDKAEGDAEPDYKHPKEL